MKYYSIDETDPDVWHDNENCPNGKQIPARNRVNGTPPDRYRQCQNCQRMG